MYITYTLKFKIDDNFYITPTQLIIKGNKKYLSLKPLTKQFDTFAVISLKLYI